MSSSRRCARLFAASARVALVLALPSTAGAASADCAPPATDGAIKAKALASRHSGVAPLAVFFDARDTLAAGTERPFHDLEYRWTFGDPDSGTWATGSRAGASSRNAASGAVAAHVFEKPGTYTVTLEITDDRYTVRNSCLRVSVLDADAYFIGDRTVCLSGDGDFTGCPFGARKVIESDRNFATALADYSASGRRLLFRRGETWHAPTPGIIRSNGPGLIGAFGAGSRPRIRATAEGATPILQLSSRASPGIRDWRIMDLELDGHGQAGRLAIAAEGGIDQITLLRLDLHDVRNGLMLSNDLLDAWNRDPRNPRHTLWDQLALVDSTTRNILGASGGYSVYASARRLMLLGNLLDNSGGGEHTVRLPSLVAGVISNNTMQGQGSAAGGKHAFTLRAAVHGSGGVEGGEDTRWVVVSDNKFIGASGSDWTVTYQPQYTRDERVVDVVTERNWFVAGSGTQFGLTLFARQQTVRNNLFDTTGGKAHGGIQVHDGLSVGSDHIDIYNNTFLSRDAGREFVAVYARSGATNVTARNNLGHAPKDVQAKMFAGPVAASHNSSDAQMKGADPRFSAKVPSTPADCKPAKGSYANGAGTAVPVWSDFFRAPRVSRDLGAVSPQLAGSRNSTQE